MNKKFLSVVLFGALMATSAGTFVSCKDYDDDINRIDNTLNDLTARLAELESTVANGDYVTNVTKTEDGKGMVFTFSGGKTVTVTLDVEDGKDAQQVTISPEGELMIDNVGTGIMAGKAEPGKPCVKIEGGYWWVLGEDGEYEDTQIPASGLTAVQDQEDKSWTLTLIDAEGNEQIIKVPSAATMITQIVVANNNVAQSAVPQAKAGVSVTSYTFKRPSGWEGPRELVANNSTIYAVSGLDIRVNPVDINIAETPFTLVNTKNVAFPSISYTATPEDGNDPIKFDDINSRAANSGNGLWSLGMQSFILNEQETVAFTDALNNANKVAYAVSAGTSSRSLYEVAIVKGSAKALTKVSVKEIDNSDANLAATGTQPTATVIEVDLNKTYTIEPSEMEAFYDMYFTIADLDKKTYDIDWDNEKRTFIVKNRPDMVTTVLEFPMTITTLDNNGTPKTAKYTVKLSSSIAATPEYDPVVYNIANLYNAATNDDFFNISLATLKEALGDNYVTWGNNVDLQKTKYYIGTKADGSDKADMSTNPSKYALSTSIVNAQGATTTDVNAAANIKVTMKKKSTTNTLKLDKQYYLTVEFVNGSSNTLNSIVVPVTFTAPNVASQFTAKSEYVVDNTIVAYFYDVDKKYVELTRFFKEMDVKATLALKKDDNVAQSGSTNYSSAQLATLTNIEKLYLKTTHNQIPVDTETNQELGYGKVLTVTANNKCYKDSEWEYNDAKNQAASFTIKVMSPIAEGSIKPAEGSSIEVIANCEKGYDITSEMIIATDYTMDTVYEIMKDLTTADPASSGDYWSSKQIDLVEVAKKDGDSNTLIKAVKLTDAKAADPTTGTPAQKGTINVTAEPLPNDNVKSAIVITVTDAWGYKTAKEVSVTIRNQK